MKTKQNNEVNKMKRNKIEQELCSECGYIHLDKVIKCTQCGYNFGYKQQLEEIAQSVGMRDYRLFVRFMIRRLPNEQSYAYMKEWAFRFMSGDPTSRMDNESIKIYVGLLNGK